MGEGGVELEPDLIERALQVPFEILEAPNEIDREPSVDRIDVVIVDARAGPNA